MMCLKFVSNTCVSNSITAGEVIKSFGTSVKVFIANAPWNNRKSHQVLTEFEATTIL